MRVLAFYFKFSVENKKKINQLKSTINTDIKATKTGKLHCVQKSHEISMGESVEKIKNRIFLKK